jgi:hypothetical protein
MIKFFYKLKSDILLMCLSITCAIAFLFDIFILLFNFIQFILSIKSPALIGSGFLGLNIIAIILNAIALIFLVVYFVLNLKNIKSK